MNAFADFNIKPAPTGFVGDKINEQYLLDRTVTVHAFKIVDSRYKKGEEEKKCLHLQLTVEGVKRVFFTGSRCLMDMINRVAPEKFPFTTKIIKKDKILVFS